MSKKVKTSYDFFTETNKLKFELTSYGVRIKVNDKNWATISYLGDSMDNAEGIAIDSYLECTTCLYGPMNTVKEEPKFESLCMDILFEELKL